MTAIVVLGQTGAVAWLLLAVLVLGLVWLARHL